MSKSHQYVRFNFKDFPIREDYYYDSDLKNKFIRDLSHINMFIGPNNSGKSRFLRSLFNQNIYTYWPSNFPENIISSSAARMQKIIENVLDDSQTINSVTRHTFVKWLNTDFISTNKENSFKFYVNLIEQISLKNSVNEYSSNIYNTDVRWSKILTASQQELQRLTNYNDTLGNEPRVYIPILRGLRPLSDIDVNAERTKKDYSFEVTDSKLIFTGHTLYKELQKLRDGDTESRRLADQYEKFLSEEFFDNLDVEVVPRVEQDSVYVKIGDSIDLPIHSLGDGIQSLIILTFMAFTSKKRTLFFIEEPDLYMHPGMQRKFLELLVRHPSFACHQFFFTTHSNHFLDMTVDYPSISTFLFKKKNGKIEIKSTSNADKNILQEIGARNSSVFLTNVSIWVEGITDRLYFREFLNKFIQTNSLKVFREDTHFSLIEYGGGNLVHFDFSELPEDLSEKINISRVCGECILILDGDSVAKSSRIKQYTDQLGDSVIGLKTKEIENLIPEQLMKKAIENLISRSRLPEADSLTDKIDLIKYSEYKKQTVKIGDYLDKKLGIKYFSAKSGTIKQKMQLCEEVVRIIQANEIEWSLTSEADEVCSKIYTKIGMFNP